MFYKVDAARTGLNDLVVYYRRAGEVALLLLLELRLPTDYMLTSWDPDLFRWLWEEEVWVTFLLFGQSKSISYMNKCY